MARRKARSRLRDRALSSANDPSPQCNGSGVQMRLLLRFCRTCNRPDVLAVLRVRSRPKKTTRATNQPKHRHNRRARIPPRHRRQHRKSDRRLSQTQRTIPTRGRLAGDQRHLENQIRKTPPVRRSRVNPANRSKTTIKLEPLARPSQTSSNFQEGLSRFSLQKKTDEL
jgi:hypothetical protein